MADQSTSPKLDVLQGAFAETVLKGVRPETELPQTLAETIKGNGLDPRQRLQIHSNNTRILLAESLAKSFPVCQALVGEQFFEAMAIRFAEQHPPRSAALFEYGGELPDFIERFEPAKSVPFLADVARLEWAWAESFHAVDEKPADAQTLAAADPEALAQSHWKPIGSARLLRSPWPIDQIWEAHQPGAPISLEEIKLDSDPVFVIVARPYLEVEVMRVGAIAAILFEKLADGGLLGAVMEEMGANGSPALAALISAELLGTPSIFGTGASDGDG